MRLIASPLAVPGGLTVQFANRKHFFAAAAEAMRRILIDEARRKKTERHGGGRERVELHSDMAAVNVASNEEILAVHDARAVCKGRRVHRRVGQIALLRRPET